MLVEKITTNDSVYIPTKDATVKMLVGSLIENIPAYFLRAIQKQQK
jgi:hypothetical protein